jgi:soluble lytic murein transglycosylase
VNRLPLFLTFLALSGTAFALFPAAPALVLEGALAWAGPEAALEQALDLVGKREHLRAIESLEGLRREPLPSPLSRKVEFLLGMLYVKGKRWKEAEIHLRQAAASYPELLDYSLFHLGESLLEQGQYLPALETLRRLLALPQDSRWKKPTRLRLADAYLGIHHISEAEKAYRSYIRDFPYSSQANRARLSLAQVALSEGRSKEAASLLLQIELKQPLSAEARQARSLWSKITPSLRLDGSQRFQRARALLAAKEYQMAAEEFKRLGANSSLPREDARRASYYVGFASFHSRSYREAVKFLTPFAESGSGAEVEESLYWLGRSHLRLRNREEGRFCLLSLTCRFPRGAWADDALFYLGLDEESEGDFLQARDTYGRLIGSFPQSELVEKAIWRRGWASYCRGDLPLALQDFRRLNARQSSSPEANQSLYWMGRTLERMDLPSDALACYGSILAAGYYDYYFFRALHRHAGIEAFHPQALGRDSLRRNPPTLPRSLSVSSNRASDSFLRRARELASLRLEEEALAEYGEAIHLLPQDPERVKEACWLSLRLGRLDQAVSWAKGCLPPNWPHAQEANLLDLALCYFPLGYFDIIRIPEKVSEIDPHLILAVIREESSFSPECVSVAGAKGLMQLMPPTASLVARQMGNPLPNDRLDLFAPELNIQLGARYLRDLLQEFKGNLTLSLASYNAGPQPVKRWLAKSARWDDDEFVEGIPYAETRAYVKRVLRSYEVYKVLYQGRTYPHLFSHATRFAS